MPSMLYTVMASRTETWLCATCSGTKKSIVFCSSTLSARWSLDPMHLRSGRCWERFPIMQTASGSDTPKSKERCTYQETIRKRLMLSPTKLSQGIGSIKAHSTAARIFSSRRSRLRATRLQVWRRILVEAIMYGLAIIVVFLVVCEGGSRSVQFL